MFLIICKVLVQISIHCMASVFPLVKKFIKPLRCLHFWKLTSLQNSHLLIEYWIFLSIF